MLVQLFVMRDKVETIFYQTNWYTCKQRRFLAHTLVSFDPFPLEAWNLFFVPLKPQMRTQNVQAKRLKSLQDLTCIPEWMSFLCPTDERFEGAGDMEPASSGVCWGHGTSEKQRGLRELSHGHTVLKHQEQKELFFCLNDKCFEPPGHQPVPPRLPNLLLAWIWFSHGGVCYSYYFTWTFHRNET